MFCGLADLLDQLETIAVLKMGVWDQWTGKPG